MNIYISLPEEAKLELAGAAQRLRIATQALEDFLAEHDGRCVSPDLQLSLDHQRESLETELDAARRQVEHCRTVQDSLQK